MRDNSSECHLAKQSAAAPRAFGFNCLSPQRARGCRHRDNRLSRISFRLNVYSSHTIFRRQHQLGGTKIFTRISEAPRRSEGGNFLWDKSSESEVQVATCKIFMNAQTFISNLLNSPSINHTFPLQSPLYQINSNHRLDLKWKPRKSGNERSDSEKKNTKSKAGREIAQNRTREK